MRFTSSRVIKVIRNQYKKRAKGPRCSLHCSAIASAERPARPGHRCDGQAACPHRQYCGMIERGGQVVMRVSDNVRQVTIKPIIERFIAPGSAIMTDEYDIYGRLTEWGFEHKTVCHGHGASVHFTGLVTRTATGFTKFTSTRWKGRGRCYGVGFGSTVEFRRSVCRFTLDFSICSQCSPARQLAAPLPRRSTRLRQSGTGDEP